MGGGKAGASLSRVPAGPGLTVTGPWPVTGGRARDKLAGGSHWQTPGAPGRRQPAGGAPREGPDEPPRIIGPWRRPVFRVRELTGLPKVMTEKCRPDWRAFRYQVTLCS